MLVIDKSPHLLHVGIFVNDYVHKAILDVGIEIQRLRSLIHSRPLTFPTLFPRSVPQETVRLNGLAWPILEFVTSTFRRVVPRSHRLAGRQELSQPS